MSAESFARPSELMRFSSAASIAGPIPRPSRPSLVAQNTIHPCSWAAPPDAGADHLLAAQRDHGVVLLARGEHLRQGVHRLAAIPVGLLPQAQDAVQIVRME